MRGSSSHLDQREDVRVRAESELLLCRHEIPSNCEHPLKIVDPHPAITSRGVSACGTEQIVQQIHWRIQLLRLALSVRHQASHLSLYNSADAPGVECKTQAEVELPRATTASRLRWGHMIPAAANASAHGQGAAIVAGPLHQGHRL